MTSTDFAMILIESLSHTTKNSYFEDQMETHNCNIEEFNSGLKKSFEDLNEVINSNDIQEYFVGEKGTSFLSLGKVFLNNFDYTIDFQFENNGRTISRLLSRDEMPYLENSLLVYFQYIADKEKGKKVPKYSESEKEQLPDNSVLLKELSAYISNIEPIDFSYLVVHKSFKENTEKANWLKTPADAYRFIDHIGMDRPNFNLCFKLKNQPELSTNHRQINKQTGKPTRSAINKKLDKFLPK